MPRKQTKAQLKTELELQVRKLVTASLPNASAATRNLAVEGILKMVDEKIAALPKRETEKPPMCEECDEEMHPFSAQEQDEHVEGFSCDQCGWSFDTYRGKA